MHRPIALALALAAALATGPAAADDDAHETAGEAWRRLEETGRVAPMKALLAKVRAHFPGTVLTARLETEHSEYGSDFPRVYEVRVLRPDGRVVEAYYGARSLELIKVEGDDGHENEDEGD